MPVVDHVISVAGHVMIVKFLLLVTLVFWYVRLCCGHVRISEVWLVATGGHGLPRLPGIISLIWLSLVWNSCSGLHICGFSLGWSNLLSCF